MWLGVVVGAVRGGLGGWGGWRGRAGLDCQASDFSVSRLKLREPRALDRGRGMKAGGSG